MRKIAIILVLSLLIISYGVFALSLDDVSTSGSNFFDNIMGFFRNFFGIQSQAQCHAGCCGPICGGCPKGQFCDVDNGACSDGTSCGSGGQHLACVGNQCVNVPGVGSNECSSHEDCGGTTTTIGGDCSCGWKGSPGDRCCITTDSCTAPTCTHNVKWDTSKTCSGGEMLFCGTSGPVCTSGTCDCHPNCHDNEYECSCSESGAVTRSGSCSKCNNPYWGCCCSGGTTTTIPTTTTSSTTTTTIPTFSCNNLKVNSLDARTTPVTVIKGQSVTISSSVSNYVLFVMLDH